MIAPEILMLSNLTRDIPGEARLVERAFGQRACAEAEAVQLVGERHEAA